MGSSMRISMLPPVHSTKQATSPANARTALLVQAGSSAAKSTV